jgi:LuxR family maltose regulon positive regulatory protein
MAAHAGRDLPGIGALYVHRGKLSYEWNDLVAATRQLEEGIARSRAVDEQLRILLDGYAALARVRFAQADDDGVAELLRRCDQTARASHLVWAAPVAAAYRARLDVHRGDLAAGERWAEEAGLGPDAEPAYLNEFALLTLARILIARNEAASALRLLARLRAAAEIAGRTGSVLETRVLEALARQAGDDEAGAHSALETALALAEPEGYVRLFVDEGAPLAALLARLRSAGRRARHEPGTPALHAYVDRLLAAFAPPGPASGHGASGRIAIGPSPALPEPLTPREGEVLALIADGLTNPEIAARLFVTVGTVKSYVNGIFAKLGAVSRTQAVARARTLGLLADPDITPR